MNTANSIIKFELVITTYLTQSTQNVILIILVGIAPNSNQWIEATQRNEPMH